VKHDPFVDRVAERAQLMDRADLLA